MNQLILYYKKPWEVWSNYLTKLCFIKGQKILYHKSDCLYFTVNKQCDKQFISISNDNTIFIFLENEDKGNIIEFVILDVKEETCYRINAKNNQINQSDFNKLISCNFQRQFCLKIIDKYNVYKAKQLPKDNFRIFNKIAVFVGLWKKQSYQLKI